MQIFSHIVKHVGLAILLCIALPVFAESAPVFDADAMPQQFDNSQDQADQADQGPSDQGQDLPPPPAPGQEGAYVPSQQAVPMGPPPASMTLDQRVRRVEQQVNNMQNNDANARIDTLQNQVQSLRGQVEQLSHQLEQMQNQQKALYADIDKRLAQQSNNTKPTTATPDLSSRDATAAVTPAATKPTRKVAAKPAKVDSSTDSAAETSNNQPNVAEEQQIYQTAYNLIKAKKYDDAVNTLQGMLKKYPSGQFASNAHYWLGELYGLMGKNDQALAEFTTVLKTYPDSPRVSDAQLKVGLIFASQSKWSDAKAAFKKVINRYPGSASARLAAEHLKQIRQAGN
jgi:tol-pal system protein YbgF